MIVSASYRTDIPAFYGEWFEKRLKAGYCMVTNPYNRRQIRRVSLLPEDVDGFVFWTRNLGPFCRRLETVRDLGRPFVVQQTVTCYPWALEPSAAGAAEAVRQIRGVAETYGPRAVVWRYDPILFSSLTPPEFHLENFEHLAGSLEGHTDEVVISFAQIYQKTARNLDQASRRSGFTWEDPPDELKLALTTRLLKIARFHGMNLSVCSQRKYIVPGAKAARCVDARRLSEIGGRPIRSRLKGNRPDCGCYESVDIGDYNTCPAGCAFCYAVLRRDLALSRYRRHDHEGEFLFSPRKDSASSQEETRQTTIF
ncbi:MAG: DUF1848 domain-containing protein [Methanothrix sp.]|jgi:Domain of unknown function (DUF1848).|uniref:DNA repair photolyase n=2 Tax=cellular organisms TaxID=131567 RepID=A0A101IKN2_9EURY|nr:MAG: Uncharacterized protein XD72_1430 [Methanothrix harundinacea]KUK96977.1 MAG: Uncharacterized protein XE07_0749 [Methanothrix harundinacea]MCP1392816.1 DUF1848 domain-containing protein [Methanothrix harundinacea]MDI9400267.1 DUF1848 domain-containing protein [Euryarchaeota archaeon]